MRILKKILIVIVSIIALLLVVALFVKKEFHSERSVLISKPRTEVFNYVKYLKNQNEYSVWARLDPNMKKTFRGTDAAPGFVSAWEGNKEVGKGEQEIKSITPEDRIDYELRFIEPFESNAHAYMITMPEGAGQTKVSWGIDGKTIYPLNIMHLFMDMDKSLGKDLEGGLANLKQQLEK